MEVDCYGFAPRLLDILDDMSKCVFMAMDFEFSGIAPRAPRASGRQTLQERYRDTKEAAERYQILQVGLTFALYDHDRERYVLKPYNMNLSPLVDERLDIERVFSFQSSAMDFLLRHNFSVEAPFTSGVPYLSNEEAELAKKIAYDRLERRHVEDMQIGSDDVEALAFLAALRHRIDAWKDSDDEELEILSRHDVCEPVSTPNGAGPPPDPKPGLSRFEKRLVHQLVRAEYPNLVTLSRGGDDSVRVIHLDEEREAEVLRRRKRGVKEHIARATGFRW
ncbi:MAG: hypothetical protein INR71_12650, partial [Terriglobus roseus]|nr:hypothetical protein [Terriglobus roseus]